MKTLIRIATLAAVTAWLPSSHADSGPSKPVQPNATLTWNRIALETIERAKPTQHQAIRLLAHVSLAQYAALATADNDTESGDAVAAARSLP